MCIPAVSPRSVITSNYLDTILDIFPSAASYLLKKIAPSKSLQTTYLSLHLLQLSQCTVSHLDCCHSHPTDPLYPFLCHPTESPNSILQSALSCQPSLTQLWLHMVLIHSSTSDPFPYYVPATLAFFDSVRIPAFFLQLKVSITNDFKIFFLMWIIFKVFIEFVAILLLSYVLVFWPRGMWDPSYPTRDQTHAPHSLHWEMKS